MKFWTHLVAALLVLCASTLAWAELNIEIVKEIDNATPIAVVPFKGPDINENIGTIVRNDLERSGLFKPLAEDKMPSRPSFGGEVLYSEWKPTGVDYLVTGTATLRPDGRYDVIYELFSVPQGQRIAGEQLTVPAELWRTAAHRISDIIFEKITGIKGAFSTHILYVNQFRQNGKPVYRLEYADADGYRPIVLLTYGEPILSPAWSPDAKKVAYVSFESGKPAIYIQTTSTRAKVKLVDFPGLNGAPAFSPDGRKLAVTLSRDGNPEIYVIDIETRALKRITNNNAIDTEARWAPDGQSLIFTSDRGGSPQIYRADVATGAVTRLTFDGSFNARADISPDGRYIAFVHKERGQQYQIAVQDLKSGVMTTLTDTPLDESPSFAPNSAMLAYATRKGSNGVLGIMSLDGRFKARLPARSGEVREPAWSPFLRKAD